MPTAKTAFAMACLAAALAGPAYAGSNTASIENCQAAIAQRLGVDAPAASYEVQSVHTSMQYRDFTFSVTAAPAINDLEVTCRARKNASVRSVTFDESAVPVSVAAASK
jgi:hypothetical protein